MLSLPNQNFTRARPFGKGSPSPGEIGKGVRNISLARMKCVVYTFDQAEPTFLGGAFISLVMSTNLTKHA